MNDRPQTSKVAIHRLNRRWNDRKSTRDRVGIQRVQKACENCRCRKTRCSGEQPRCQNCVNQAVPCTYPQARKDRLKNQLFALLKDLNAHVDDVGQQMIGELLASLGETSPVPSGAMGTLTPSEESQDANTEVDVSESVGYNTDLDLLNENLFRSHESRATGFVGQSSEVQWFRSLKSKMQSPASTGLINRLPYGPPGCSDKAAAHRVDAEHASQILFPRANSLHVSDFSFYLDVEDLDMDIFVDPYELPPPETAEALFECYTRKIHTSFPILPDTFEAQFRKYNESTKRNQPYQVPESWQAILNLVLAIGAQYSHLAQPNWRADESSHFVYMKRAIRILGLDKMITTLSVPTLSLIQATGLLSLYYLTVGQLSRAWMMIGVSLRYAIAVGLHLRNDDPSTLPSKKESLARTWWGLHSIENLLCTLIGRPCIMPNGKYTVPLPQVLPEGPRGESNPIQLRNPNYQNNTVIRASFVGACATITIITEKALSKLYSPQTSIGTWKQTQKEIDALSRELDEWLAVTLPKSLGLADSIQEPAVKREQLLLSFQYYSAKILIHRPCLCHLEQSIKGQSKASADFNQKAAEACVEAAQAVTGLFPDKSNHTFIYQQSPWWCIVHYIMQAIAVFLLEISSKTPMAHHDKRILKSIKKLVQWLQSISARNIVARRAYEVVVDIIHTSASRLRVDPSDILAEGEADQDHSFETHQLPESMELPLYRKDPFPCVERDIPSSGNPTTSVDFDTQYPTTFLERQPAQDLGASQPDQYFRVHPDFQMPSMFGDGFFTNFNVFNSLEGRFSHGVNAILDDAQSEPF